MAHYRPPRIIPNYGKKKSVMPKSCLKHVLLHENTSHQTMLNEKIRQLDMEADRNKRILQLHRTSFIVQQSYKQQQLRAMGINHISFLPDNVVEAHISINRYSDSDGKGEKKLPMHARIKREQDKRRKSESSSNIADEIDKVKQSNDPSANTGWRLTQSALAKRGLTKTFSTHNEIEHLRREKTYGFMGEHKAQTRLSREDPRFQHLEESLLPLEYKMDGYLRLSPSGRRVMRQYGNFHAWLLPESRRTSMSSSYEPDPKEQVSKFMSSIGVKKDTNEQDLDIESELDISKEYEEIMKIVKDNENESIKSTKSIKSVVNLPPLKGSKSLPKGKLDKRKSPEKRVTIRSKSSTPDNPGMSSK